METHLINQGTGAINELKKIIELQKEKEFLTQNLWKDSEVKVILDLTKNSVGNVGEIFCNNVCKHCNIHCDINGTKTKEKGGGTKGDGFIMDYSVEVKTSYLGVSKTFQHELGETPWVADFLIFIDIEPNGTFMTIINNFSETDYRNHSAFTSIFPSKKVTQRKGTGNFKFDTSINLYKNCKQTKYITQSTNIEEIGFFINEIFSLKKNAFMI